MEKWHGTLARYNKKVNAVAERRIKNFSNYTDALEWLDTNQHLPIQIWHDDAVNLSNPYFAIVETIAYKNEYQKIID